MAYPTSGLYPDHTLYPGDFMNPRQQIPSQEVAPTSLNPPRPRYYSRGGRRRVVYALSLAYNAFVKGVPGRLPSVARGA